MIDDFPVPKFVPGWLRPVVALYRLETKRNKWTYGVLAVVFLFLVCQFIFNSFAPGKYLILRQLLFAPLFIIGSWCVVKFAKVGFVQSGIFPYLIVFIGMNLIRALRADGLDEAFAVLIIEPTIYGGIWFWARSQSSKPSTP